MPTPPRDDLVRAMVRTPVLASTAEPAVRALVGEGSVRAVRRGSYLFDQGDDAREIFFLHEGTVELSSVSAGGSRGLYTTVGPPQFFGELPVLAETPHTTSAVALEDSTVWAIPGRSFVAFLGEQSGASMGLLRALARQVQAHESLVDDLLFLDLKGRVAKRLLALVSPSLDELPEAGALVPSIVTHAALASLAGGSRENVTRILSDFQRRGFVERDGKRYVLTNIAALRKLAGL